jgi:hypothetical protein
MKNKLQNLKRRQEETKKSLQSVETEHSADHSSPKQDTSMLTTQPKLPP